MDGPVLCGRAVAYLVSRGRDERPAVTLPLADAPVLTDLGNGLSVGYVVDQGEYFQYIQHRHMWAAGIAQAELHRNAVANLAAMLNDRNALVHAWDDAYAVIFDGNFEASLILVDGLWDKALAHFAPNGFLAALPNKNLLAFCDLKTPRAAQQLRRIIDDVGLSDRPITTTLYYRDPTRRDWRPYRDESSISS
jgi:uncharacterized protein YtpQ (UPF0354 family)